MHAVFTMPRMLRRIAVVGLISVATLGVVACGGDDDSDDLGTTATTEPTAAATEDGEMTAEPTTENNGAGEATPPAADSGTVTLAGTTYELSEGDFQICETVNPAFANDFNVIVDLPGEDLGLRVNGDLEDMDPELHGVFLRDTNTFIDEQATNAVVTRDGRVLSGSGTLEAGEVEFSFSC